MTVPVADFMYSEDHESDSGAGQFHHHQTWINHYLNPLAHYHATNLSKEGASTHMPGYTGQGYKRLFVLEGGSHPSGILQKLMSFSGIYDFLNLKPHEAAQLIPRMRLFREVGVTNIEGGNQYYEGSARRYEIGFDNHLS